MGAAGEAAGIMTAGQLRAVLEGVPDDAPVIVTAARCGRCELEEAAEQVIASAGWGFIDQLGGYRFVPSGEGIGYDDQDVVLALGCREPDYAELNRMVYHRHPCSPLPVDFRPEPDVSKYDQLLTRRAANRECRD